MKQELRGKKEIDAALRYTFVFCSIPSLDEKKTFVVRDVRRSNGFVEVKILEGWFIASEVWMDESSNIVR